MSNKKREHIVLNKLDYAKFRRFLKDNNIQFEPSGYGVNVYVSLNVTEEEHTIINNFLSTLDV